VSLTHYVAAPVSTMIVARQEEKPFGAVQGPTIHRLCRHIGTGRFHNPGSP
jgi:hypothetical protein